MTEDLGVPPTGSGHSDEPASSLAADAGSAPNAAFAEWAETVSTNMNFALSTGVDVPVRAVPIEAWQPILDRLSCAPDDWKPIETAPAYRVLEIKAGKNMTFLASLNPGASLDENGQPCDQWFADVEGEHPPCWTDGACWASNSDEIASLQPTHWRYAAQAIEAQRAETGSGASAPASPVPHGDAPNQEPSK